MTKQICSFHQYLTVCKTSNQSLDSFLQGCHQTTQLKFSDFSLTLVFPDQNNTYSIFLNYNEHILELQCVQYLQPSPLKIIEKINCVLFCYNLALFIILLSFQLNIAPMPSISSTCPVYRQTCMYVWIIKLWTFSQFQHKQTSSYA